MLYGGRIPDNHFIGERIEVWYDPDNCSESSHGKPVAGILPYIPVMWGIPVSLISLFSKKKIPER